MLKRIFSRAAITCAILGFISSGRAVALGDGFALRKDTRSFGCLCRISVA
jgi:hypothetical protein